jgi:CHASE2 domain-containing sensor protein
MNGASNLWEYGDLIAIAVLLFAVGCALVVVLRGFQPRQRRRNVLSIVAILLSSLLAFASLHYLRLGVRK